MANQFLNSRLRFSLRSLLLLVLVIASVLGLAIHEARKQRFAVAELKKRNCQIIRYDDIITPPTLLEQFREFIGEPEPRNVDVVRAQKFTDADCIHLQGLSQLQALDLSGTQVTDDGMVYIRWNNQLGSLYLINTRVTDSGLINVRNLTQLESLRLDGTSVSDAGLVHLQKLTHLRVLGLLGLRITDAGLTNLHDLTQLEHLLISGTAVTDAGVKKLQNAIPNCKVTVF